MSRLGYLSVMAFVVIGSGWLEWGLRTRVLIRWRRLVLTLAPVLVVFAIWDAYAIRAGHWWFDTSRILGWRAPGEIPVEELVFFVVVPTAAILTLEAVRSATGLPVGDEPGQKPAEAVPERPAGSVGQRPAVEDEPTEEPSGQTGPADQGGSS